MKINFSQSASKALSLACDEALRTGYRAIGTDHIMLGILRFRRNHGHKILSDLNVDLEEMKDYIDSRIIRSKSISYDEIEEIKPDHQAFNTIQGAVNEAFYYDEDLNCFHLLLSICRTKGCAAAEYLHEHGLDYDFLKSFKKEWLPQINQKKPVNNFTPEIMNVLAQQLTQLTRTAGENFLN